MKYCIAVEDKESKQKEIYIVECNNIDKLLALIEMDFEILAFTALT